MSEYVMVLREALEIVVAAAEPMRLKEAADCLLGTIHRNPITKAIAALSVSPTPAVVDEAGAREVWTATPHHERCKRDDNAWTPRSCNCDHPIRAMLAFANRAPTTDPLADAGKPITTERGGEWDAATIERLTRVVVMEARKNGADSPRDFGDAEQIVRAILRALSRPTGEE